MIYLVHLFKWKMPISVTKTLIRYFSFWYNSKFFFFFFSLSVSNTHVSDCQCWRAGARAVVDDYHLSPAAKHSQKQGGVRRKGNAPGAGEWGPILTDGPQSRFLHWRDKTTLFGVLTLVADAFCDWFGYSNWY